MLNAKDEEYFIMVTGRDKELHTFSGRLSKLQNEFDLSAATISEFKVNEHKG